jgi:uncharacterized damage-inducible protein DinB
MNDSIAKQFLEISASRLEVHSSRIDDCLGRLTHDQLWWRAAEAQNSIANLVLHLCGNLKQYTGALENIPDTRDRDREFEQRSDDTSDQLRELLKATVSNATAAFRKLPAARLTEVIHVQVYERQIMQAVYMVVDHFAQHTGQIIYATKLITGHDLGYYAHLTQRPRISPK